MCISLYGKACSRAFPKTSLPAGEFEDTAGSGTMLFARGWEGPCGHPKLPDSETVRVG